MFKAIAISGLLLGAAVPAAAPGPTWPALKAYYQCEDAAQRGALDRTGWHQCAVLYHHIKLRFVGLDPGAFDALTREQRSAANRQGFRAFRAWELSHPEAVARLKAEGRAGNR